VDRTPRTCPVCDKSFVPKVWNQRYCTGYRGQCYRRAMNARQRGRPIIRGQVGLPFDCDWCGSRAVPGQNCGPSSRRFCCRRCKHSWHRAHDRKRAEQFGVQYEPISKVLVFQRDSYRCGICGEQTDHTVDFPDPLAPTLDHVVPMSKGGPHLYSNVQCAHFECNKRKADSSPPQLAFAA
jgi:5-methylcytosine-specific restriction endonuclease McrA